VETPEAVEYNSLAATLPVRGEQGGYQAHRTRDATLTSDNHDIMSWTACYDDECYTYMSDKQGSGWFPTRKSRSVCFTCGGHIDQLQGIVYSDGYTSPNEESSEDEASDDQDVEEGEIVEESDDESDTLTNTFPPNDVTLVVIRIIIQKRLEVFPYYGNLQHVNEDKFLDMVNDIRRAVYNVPIVPSSTNYRRIVTERPPFGSRFTMRGGYTTPDGIVICRVLRNKIKTLQEEFANEART
jgi:hypothetical protein